MWMHSALNPSEVMLLSTLGNWEKASGSPAEAGKDPECQAPPTVPNSAGRVWGGGQRIYTSNRFQSQADAAGLATVLGRK